MLQLRLQYSVYSELLMLDMNFLTKLLTADLS